MKSRILAIAVTAFAVGFMAIAMPTSASAASASPGEFVADVNALRASKGLPTLSVNASLSTFAQAWAEKMAAAGGISHNPNLKGAPGNWTTVGENVGVGGSEKSIFNALVASSGHYANMVSSKYNSIGVGVATGADGRIYTTHNFATYPGGATKSSAAKPSTTSAPKTTAAPKSNTTAKPATTQAPVAAGSQAPVAAATPAAEAPAAAVAPLAPLPSERIVQGTIEIGSIATQG